VQIHYGILLCSVDGLSGYQMVPATSVVKCILRRSTGRSNSGVVLEMHTCGHAVCLETATKCWGEAGRTDGWTERAVDILVWR